MVPRPQANSSFFVLHSSFTKANIRPFRRSTKNEASVIRKNLLTKSRFHVNKTNALIYSIKNNVFVQRKRRFSVFSHTYFHSEASVHPSLATNSNCQLSVVRKDTIPLQLTVDSFVFQLGKKSLTDIILYIYLYIYNITIIIFFHFRFWKLSTVSCKGSLRFKSLSDL